MGKAVDIRNGRVVTPTGVLEGGRVLLEGSQIARVDASSDQPLLPGSKIVDADERIVMPGLIDLHGDDIEHQLYPRSNARVDARTALVASDRENLLNGITTKFHAIAFEDAPNEDRTIDSAASLAREISTATYTLGDNRIHARCEVSEASVAAVQQLCADVDLLSVMYHAPDDGQYDAEGFKRHYVDNKHCSATDAAQLALERRGTSRSEMYEWVARVAELAESHDIPLASHDDDTIEKVDRMAESGISISEYPVTLSAAKRAEDRGMTTAMGAPNLVRGGSLCENLSVRTAIEDAAIDILCVDYHPPSLLAAPFVETGELLADRIARVTRNPADAVGLSDRGRIEPGARGDLLVVNPEPVPTADRIFVDGDEVFQRPPDHHDRTISSCEPSTQTSQNGSL